MNYTTATPDLLDELEMEWDQPSQPNTTGSLRPVQQRNRRMARRALMAKLGR